MFRRMMAVLLLAAPSAAAFGQSEEDMGGWALATMPNGCMVQATSPQGTMLTIWGFAGADKLAFLLQNREWSSLQDGRSYALSLSFEDAKAYPVDLVAKLGVIDDEIGGHPVAVVAEPGADPKNRTIRAYDRGDRVFTRSGRSFLGASFLNDQGGRAWKIGEEALTATDGQKRLRLPGRLALQAVWTAAYPGVPLYREPKAP